MKVHQVGKDLLVQRLEREGRYPVEVIQDMGHSDASDLLRLEGDIAKREKLRSVMHLREAPSGVAGPFIKRTFRGPDKLKVQRTSHERRKAGQVEQRRRLRDQPPTIAREIERFLRRSIDTFGWSFSGVDGSGQNSAVGRQLVSLDVV